MVDSKEQMEATRRAAAGGTAMDMPYNKYQLRGMLDNKDGFYTLPEYPDTAGGNPLEGKKDTDLGKAVKHLNEMK